MEGRLSSEVGEVDFDGHRGRLSSSWRRGQLRTGPCVGASVRDTVRRGANHQRGVGARPMTRCSLGHVVRICGIDLIGKAKVEEVLARGRVLFEMKFVRSCGELASKATSRRLTRLPSAASLSEEPQHPRHQSKPLRGLVSPSVETSSGCLMGVIGVRDKDNRFGWEGRYDPLGHTLLHEHP